MKLSRLCEQDKTLKELESRISTLKDDKVRHYTQICLHVIISFSFIGLFDSLHLQSLDSS